MGTTVNITFSQLSIGLGTTTTCTNGWSTYIFYGGLTGPDIFTVNHPGVSGNVFYWQVRIIYGIITVDNWNTNTIITTTFDTDPTTTQFNNQLGNQRSRVCNGNSRD
jgi:hypothetical protein